MKHFGPEEARAALERWGGDPATLEHLATSGNDVYRYRDGGEPRILRLTDLAWRSAAQNDAELAFLEHAVARGVRAAAPLRSLGGARVEAFAEFSACATRWAPGAIVVPDTPPWGEALLREWGRHLGELQAAAREYAGPPRWEWWQEGLLVEAPELIPADDRESRAEFALVLDHVHAFPRRATNYGMIHADFGPQNFHWADGIGITSFDYGNCCRHWFAADLVISLSTLRRRTDRDLCRDRLLAGYREATELDPEIWAEAGWLLRLRVLYVYLSRLKLFGRAPTAEQAGTLAMLRGLVAQKLDWH